MKLGKVALAEPLNEVYGQHELLLSLRAAHTHASDHRCTKKRTAPAAIFTEERNCVQCYLQRAVRSKECHATIKDTSPSAVQPTRELLHIFCRTKLRAV